jgi:hypothetical protein
MAADHRTSCLKGVPLQNWACWPVASLWAWTQLSPCIPTPLLQVSPAPPPPPCHPITHAPRTTRLRACPGTVPKVVNGLLGASRSKNDPRTVLRRRLCVAAGLKPLGNRLFPKFQVTYESGVDMLHVLEQAGVVHGLPARPLSACPRRGDGEVKGSAWAEWKAYRSAVALWAERGLSNACLSDDAIARVVRFLGDPTGSCVCELCKGLVESARVGALVELARGGADGASAGDGDPGDPTTLCALMESDWPPDGAVASLDWGWEELAVMDDVLVPLSSTLTPAVCSSLGAGALAPVPVLESCPTPTADALSVLTTPEVWATQPVAPAPGFGLLYPLAVHRGDPCSTPVVGTVSVPGLLTVPSVDSAVEAVRAVMSSCSTPALSALACRPLALHLVHGCPAKAWPLPKDALPFSAMERLLLDPGPSNSQRLVVVVTPVAGGEGERGRPGPLGLGLEELPRVPWLPDERSRADPTDPCSDADMGQRSVSDSRKRSSEEDREVAQVGREKRSRECHTCGHGVSCDSGVCVGGSASSGAQAGGGGGVHVGGRDGGGDSGLWQQ